MPHNRWDMIVESDVKIMKIHVSITLQLDIENDNDSKTQL